MSRLRVAMFVKHGVPFEIDWARAVAPYVDLFVICMTHQRRPPPTVEGACEVHVLQTPRLRPTRVFRQVAGAIWRARALSILAEIERRSGGVDLLHGHFYPVGELLAHLRSARALPFVLTEHSSRLTGSSARHKPLSRLGLMAARSAFSAAEAVFLPSSYLGRCVEKLGLRGRFVVTGSPIDVEAFRPGQASPDGLRIAWVGRLEEDKAPLVALQAFRLAQQRLPTLRLDMVGDGPDRSLVERWIRRNGLGDHVTLWGRQPRSRVAEILRDATAFLSSSMVETFGISVAEALACGIPVVVPALPALREWVHPSFCVFYPPGDSDAAAMALTNVERISSRFHPEASAEDIRRRFGFPAVGEAVVRTYMEVLSEGVRTEHRLAASPSGQAKRPSR